MSPGYSFQVLVWLVGGPPRGFQTEGYTCVRGPLPDIGAEANVFVISKPSISQALFSSKLFL